MSNSAYASLFYGIKIGSEEDGLPDWLEEGDSKIDLSDSPLKLVRSGHYDYPTYWLALASSFTETDGWGAETVSIEGTTVSLMEEAEAAAWCTKLGTVWKNPSWVLTSFFG